MSQLRCLCFLFQPFITKILQLRCKFLLNTLLSFWAEGFKMFVIKNEFDSRRQAVSGNNFFPCINFLKMSDDYTILILWPDSNFYFSIILKITTFTGRIFIWSTINWHTIFLWVTLWELWVTLWNNCYTKFRQESQRFT